MATAKKKTTKSSGGRKKAPTNVVKPGKDIVASMAEDFKKRLMTVIKKGIDELIIDLSGVEIVDSIGLGLMIATHNSLNNQGGKLSVINASKDVIHLFKTMRLDQHFEVQSAS